MLAAINISIPIWSPKKANNIANKALTKKPESIIRLSKLSSNKARAPPSTESRAAKIAIERYLAMPKEAFTVRMEPKMAPTARLPSGKISLYIFVFSSP